jgi:hypothetical protein
VEAVPAKSQKESTPKFCGGSVVPLNLKKNPLQNSVEAVPATSQKESTPKFCGGSSRHISKRTHTKILWRQSPLNLKKNPHQNSVEAVPAKSQKHLIPKRIQRKFLWYNNTTIKPGGTVGYPANKGRSFLT